LCGQLDTLSDSGKTALFTIPSLSLYQTENKDHPNPLIKHELGRSHP
jgi:hypothetical protein